MAHTPKLPPYAKELLALKEPYPYVFIFMGKNAWVRAKSFRHPYFPSTLVFPPDTSVYDYSWPVKDQDVWLLNTNHSIDASWMKEVAVCLFNHNAKSVRYVDKDASLTVFSKGA